MARFLTYITGIETLTAVGNHGDGSCVFHFQCTGFGLSGDAGANIILPALECSGDLSFKPYGFLDFPNLEVSGQAGYSGHVDFPLLECEGSLSRPNRGNASFPLPECSGEGRSGNEGNCNFYLLLVNGEGNANREYELCE